MNLIIHQFKTDWRHFRGGLAGLWALFATQLILAWPYWDNNTSSGIEFFLLLFQVAVGLFLIVWLVQADALAGTSAQWLARPVRRCHLFWSKTVFLIICLGLARLVPLIILGCWHHYPASLLLAMLAENLMFTLAVAGMIAALAALTPDMPRFFLMLAVILGGFFIWMVILVNFHHGPSRSQSLDASAIVAAFCLFGGGNLFAWTWQVRTGRATVSYVVLVIGLLALPGIIMGWSWNFLAPKLQALPAPGISGLDNHPLTDPSAGQALWSKFLVTGLPSHSLVVAEDVKATFHPNGEKWTYDLPPFRQSRTFPAENQRLSRVMPMDSPQQADYLAVIHGFFPPETLWAGWRSYLWGGFPGLDKKFRHATNGPVTGSLDFQMELDEFNVRSGPQIPLKPGVWNIAPGKRLVLHELKPQADGIQVELEEIQAVSSFNRAPYAAGMEDWGRQEGLFTYVLYEPDWGQAIVLNNNQYSSSMPGILNGESHLLLRYVLPYPALQERLAGTSLPEFLDKACLRVFVPVYQGTIHQSLHETNFNLSSASAPAPGLTDNLKDMDIIDRATLPLHPTAAQTSDYLDTILWHIPDNLTPARRQHIQQRLAAAGPAGISLLLARLPMDDQTENNCIFPLLTKFATREQLPELREALGRDLHLANWFDTMGWDNDARDILAGQLGDHRLDFPALALRLAAEAHDPATYHDLTWHFARLDGGQAAVADALAKCPGFDLTGAVQEAWRRVELRLNQAGELPLIAARQGLPNAFNQAVIRLEESKVSPAQRQYQAMQLTALTDYSGRPETAMDWLSANLGRFRYVAANHQYTVDAQASAR